MSRSKYWLFTLNNPQDVITFSNWKDCQYGVYQLERGESGTLHYQGYAEFTNKKTLQTVKTYLNTAHWEPRRGSQEQAIQYCTKPESRVAEGIHYGTPTPNQQGKRNDLDEIRLRIERGSPERNIARDAFGSWTRYFRSFRTYRCMVQPNRTWKSQVAICYGAPGTGKSKWALESTAPENQYWKQRSGWWDGYEGHPTVVLDDYYGWLPWDTLLRLCDRYPMLVETKGGQANFTAQTIILTSNTLPHKWYKEHTENWRALERRVEKWIYFHQSGFTIFTSYNMFLSALNLNK